MTEPMIYRLLPSAYKVLPEAMYSPKATILLIAIGLQESGFTARRQMPHGPARGFWMFEPAGVARVLKDKQTKGPIADAGAALCYPKLRRTPAADVCAILEDNDVLAAVFARCLLWTLTAPLPQTRDDAAEGWTQYVEAWAPGKPRRRAWEANYTAAWDLIDPMP